MLIEIETSDLSPATDLGYLLHKNPQRVHDISFSFGKGTVFYPQADAQTCSVALLMEVDNIDLRKRMRDKDELLSQYVNDRPYTCSSFMSVLLKRAFCSAMSGSCKEKPQLPSLSINFKVRLSCLKAGSDELIKKLFEPLGYQLWIERYELEFDWGKSPYVSLALAKKTTLSQLLKHLYVLLPVLDNDKHYWVARDEVEKLLAEGEGWLKHHPEKEMISRRYLKYRGALTRQALKNLHDGEVESVEIITEKEVIVKRTHNKIRLQGMIDILRKLPVKSVLDLGCGEGRLLQLLMKEKYLYSVSGVDVSLTSLKYAAERLKMEFLPQMQKERLHLFQSSATHLDRRFSKQDLIFLVEVIEHMDEDRLPDLEASIWGEAAPQWLVVTTPNREYNCLFDMKENELRHGDHRFEWTRKEFSDWASAVAVKYNYRVNYQGLGAEDPLYGAITQVAVFEKQDDISEEDKL